MHVCNVLRYYIVRIVQIVMVTSANSVNSAISRTEGRIKG